jgi:hypothetical protein
MKATAQEGRRIPAQGYLKTRVVYIQSLEQLKRLFQQTNQPPDDPPPGGLSGYAGLSMLPPPQKGGNEPWPDSS